MQNASVMPTGPRTPQEKKQHSLAHDRRNTYGENDKSTRKSIPRSRQRGQMQLRRGINQALQPIGPMTDEVAQDVAADVAEIEAVKRLRRFKKSPDTPLGQVLQLRRERKVIPIRSQPGRVPGRPAATKHPLLSLAEPIDLPSAGRLGQLLPELADWIAAALLQVQEPAASAAIHSLHVRACWRGLADNYNISPVPRESRTLIFKESDRRSLWLPRPKGVRRRGWSIGVLIVQDAVMEIGIGRPSVLRPALDHLERVVDRLHRGSDSKS